MRVATGRAWNSSGMPVASAGAGSLALAALGAVIVLATLADLLLTIFNFDGFTFIAARFQPALWKVVRVSSRLLPRSLRPAALAVGSASMLPATVALWLGLEIVGFALMFDRGLATGSFSLRGVEPSLGSALYLSAGAISSLSFGDVFPRTALYRALVDLETIIGLATFTLALGYVVAAFDALGALERLHGRVRRHAEDPGAPSSILSRHLRGGHGDALPSFLQALGDDLEGYDQGLRRYPVVYYFHTRRLRRSIPVVFSTLGELLALIRWGLSPQERVTRDPFLAALLDGYGRTLDRLRRSFVGPDPIRLPEPLPENEFARAYAAGGDEGVDGFRALEARAAACAGTEVDDAEAYERYREWLPFAHLQRVTLDRVADALGYERPSRLTESPPPAGRRSQPSRT